MLADPEWFLELTRQVHKRRFVATGGALKNVLQLERETNEDLIMADDMAEGTDDGSRLAFSWVPVVKKYQRDRAKDKRRLSSDDWARFWVSAMEIHGWQLFALQKRTQTLSNAIFCIWQWFYMFWLIQAVRDVLSAILTMIWMLFVVCG